MTLNGIDMRSPAFNDAHAAALYLTAAWDAKMHRQPRAIVARYVAGARWHWSRAMRLHRAWKRIHPDARAHHDAWGR